MGLLAIPMKITLFAGHIVESRFVEVASRRNIRLLLITRGLVGDMFDKDMYAAFDLGQRTIRAVMKSQDGKIVDELKIKKQADTVLRFLKGTNANVVMESGYNYQYLYDLLKSKGYNVKVARPLMVKAIAYANVSMYG
jgi:hypothetical protein